MAAYHEIPTYTSELPMLISKFDRFSFLAHWHKDIEVVYVYEGYLRMSINFQTKILTAGEFGICSSGDVHFYDSEDLRCNAILIVFRTDFISSSISWPENAPFISSFFDKALIDQLDTTTDLSKKIGNLFLELLNETTETMPYYQVFVKSKLLELYGLLLRNIPKQNIPINPTKSYLLINKMQNALNYINYNYKDNITLSDVAKQADLGISQFSKLFKHLCGMSFITYLNNVRVSKAEDLLTNSTFSITDIALECGFNSIRNFNRTYKTLRSYAPSSLRKSI